MDSSTFKCDAVGKSSLTVTWLKNGEMISESDSDVSISYTETNEDNTFVGNSTLTIESFELTNVGTYTCQAENNEGKSQYNYTVDVYGR